MRGTQPTEYALVLGGQLRRLDPAHAVVIDPGGRVRALPGAPPALARALLVLAPAAQNASNAAAAGAAAAAVAERIHLHVFSAKVALLRLDRRQCWYWHSSPRDGFLPHLFLPPTAPIAFPACVQ